MIKIGVGVIIQKENKILLGKRKSAHGLGTWSFPGGHLEENETPEVCAIRETFEETGLEIAEVKPFHWSYDIFEESGKRYITLFMRSENIKGIPQVMEPEKCECWQWFAWNDFPSPLFKPIPNLLAQMNGNFMR
jgi:8-oxo-dGTP diphosphatase